MKDKDINSLRICVLNDVKDLFFAHENISLFNTQKILDAFRKNNVSEYYFNTSSGYGYSDVGRDALDKVYADVFKTEKAIVRSQFVSGTHALSTALFGILRSGDEMLAVTGKPYDTLQTVIGADRKQKGSLCEHGIKYRELDLKKGQDIDLSFIKENIKKNTRLVHIQRSKGYSDRKTLSVAEIGQICEAVKSVKKDCICFVDNCYGEFVEKSEPTEVGADIIAGSLIKNPGGGLAPSGGYIAGKADLVELAAFQYSAPGLGSEMGSCSSQTQRLLYQGLFLAPHVTLQAVKSAIFAAALFAKLGYDVLPDKNALRSDIIQSINLKTKEALIAFCQSIQTNSPVDGHVLPLPGRVPGYEDDVIMAAGTFVQGASIELSADGPTREPYTVYLQGALTFEHSMLALVSSAKSILDKN